MAKSAASKQFVEALRAKVGVAPPAQEQIQGQIQSAWTQLEEGLAGVKESADVLGQAAEVDPIVQRAISDSLLQLADGLEQVVASVEAMEALLVDAGLVEDDQLLEPASPAADG